MVILNHNNNFLCLFLYIDVRKINVYIGVRKIYRCKKNKYIGVRKKNIGVRKINVYIGVRTINAEGMKTISTKHLTIMHHLWHPETVVKWE